MGNHLEYKALQDVMSQLDPNLKGALKKAEEVPPDEANKEWKRLRTNMRKGFE